MNEASGKWTSWAAPLVAGFLLSTAAVALLVPPRANSLSWPVLLGHSAGLLALAATLAIGGVWAMHRLLDDYIGPRPAAAVLACAWSAAIWLPLLLLLRSEHALWVIAAPLPIAVIVTRFAKRQIQQAAEPSSEIEASALAPAEPASREADVLFATVYALQPRRLAGAALLSAALLQGLIAAIAAQAYPWAESLTILLAATLVWGFSSGETTPSGQLWQRRFRRSSILPCFLLTCLALTPFLRSALESFGFRQVVLAGVAPVVALHKVVPGTAYTGFILTAPPMPKHLRIERPSPPSPLASALRKEQLIPFDGVYWYYESDISRPGPDAPIRRGDPIANTIRSAGFIPLSMEAHQRLGTHVAANCCGELAVDLRDADNRIGSISVEAVLRDASAPGRPTLSLGTVPIRASLDKKISLYRPPIDERLHFSLRHLPQDFRFNEVTLLIHPAHERSMAGARVKIKDFALEP